MELEASRNPRLKLLRDFGLNEDSKGLSCPVVQGKGKEEEGRILCKHEASKFRGGVALMNFLGQDRPDVQYATKQASHKMASPTETDLPRLKRIARYLVEAERVGLALPRRQMTSPMQLRRSWTVIGLDV